MRGRTDVTSEGHAFLKKHLTPWLGSLDRGIDVNGLKPLERNHPANYTPLLSGTRAAGRVVTREARQFAGSAALFHTSGSSSSMRAMGQPS